MFGRTHRCVNFLDTPMTNFLCRKNGSIIIPCCLSKRDIFTTRLGIRFWTFPVRDFQNIKINIFCGFVSLRGTLLHLPFLGVFHAVAWSCLSVGYRPTEWPRVIAEQQWKLLCHIVGTRCYGAVGRQFIVGTHSRSEMTLAVISARMS